MIQNLPPIIYSMVSGDSVGYHNLDGSYVLISDTSCLDCKIDTLK